MTTNQDHVSVRRLRPNGRGDFVRVDEWACDDLMSSGLNVGFIGTYQKEPYAWAVHDTSNPLAFGARGVSRLHWWVWDCARRRTATALVETLHVALLYGCQPLVSRVTKLLAQLVQCQRSKGTVIHHLNEREADNRLSNLMLMTVGGHNRHHKARRKQGARTRVLNQKVTTGTGWWRDMPVKPGRSIPVDEYLRGQILTDALGRPIAAPQPPGANATTEGIIAWLRADAAYRDSVAELGNRAFERQLRASLKSHDGTD